MKCRFASAILLATLSAQEPTSPLSGTAPAKLQTDQKDLAGIEGRTVNAAGQPLRKSNLTLRSMDTAAGETPKAPYAAVSDAEGKFSIEGIEPGRYQLMADRQGYLRQTYGGKPNAMQGTMLSLSAGQRMKDITLQMVPQAVISGKVVDEDGDPVGRAQVRAMRQGFSNGKRQLVPSSAVMSDDAGEFKIANLGPGRYYLNAISVRRNMFGEAARPAGDTDKPEQDYVPTYYPGVVDLTSAAAIEVAAGRNLSGMDIPLRKSRVFRVRGKVTGTLPNQSIQQLRVMVLPRDGFMGFMSGGSANIAKDGSFELTGVQPGAITVAAVNMDGMLQVLARQSVDVTNGNVDGVVLTLQPLGELRGTVKVEGETKAVDSSGQSNAPPPQTMHARIFLVPSDGAPAFNQLTASTNNDGSFVLPNVGPGKYRLNVFGIPQGTYLKSVLLENQEVLASGFDLSQGAAGRSLQVVFSAKVGQIDGTIQTDQQQSSQGTIVTLIPDPPQPEQTYLYRVTTADQSGRFSLKDLAPGKYRLFAWEQLENGAQFDPEFLKPHESQSVQVTLSESGHEQPTLKRIAAAKVEEAKQND